MNATQTFQEYSRNNPNLYDGISGYSWSEAEGRWVETPVSESTKETIMDWFGYRTVCNDDKFGTFFSRKMNLCALRYAQLLRIEMSVFDPLVSDYMERESLENISKAIVGNDKSTKSGTDSVNGTNTNTRTPDITTTENGSNTHSGEDSRNSNNTTDTDDSRTSTDTTKHTGTNESIAKQMNKNAPQSISYPTAMMDGNLPILNWQYATTQGQADNKGSESSNDTVDHTESGRSATAFDGSENGTNSSKDNSTMNRHETGTESNVNVEDRSVTRNETSENNNNVNEDTDANRREIHSGRSGITPQDALKQAAQYLKRSSAFEWLRDELEVCFLSVYDI